MANDVRVQVKVLGDLGRLAGETSDASASGGADEVLRDGALDSRCLLGQ